MCVSAEEAMAMGTSPADGPGWFHHVTASELLNMFKLLKTHLSNLSVLLKWSSNNRMYLLIINVFRLLKSLLNRPGVAGAVLQTALQLN